MSEGKYSLGHEDNAEVHLKFREWSELTKPYQAF